jgi:RecJ-like exonuclease
MSVKDFEICPECEGEGSPSNPANCKPGSYCKRCGGTGKIMRIGNPDSLPKQLCNSCGKTQPIMPNGKCFLIWKRDFEKPKIVDPDFLRKMRIGL